MSSVYSIKNKSGEILYEYKIDSMDKPASIPQKAIESAIQNLVMLTDADLRNVVLDGAVLTNGYLNGADLSGSIIKGSNLDYVELKGAVCKGTKFINTSLEGADISRMQAPNSYWHKVNLDGATMHLTKIPHSTLNQVNASHSSSKAGLSLVNTVIYKSTFEMSNHHGALLNDAIFTKTSLAKSDMTGNDLTNTVFKSSDLANCSFLGSFGTNIKFLKTPLSSLRGFSTDFENMVVNGHLHLKPSPANFESIARHSLDYKNQDYQIGLQIAEAIYKKDQHAINKLKDIFSQLHMSELIELDGFSFANRDLSGLDLRGFDFTCANFTNTMAQGADFSGNVMSGVLVASKSKDTKLDWSGVLCNGTDLNNSILLRVILDNSEFKNTSASSLVVDQCEGTNVNFSALQSNKLFIINSVLPGANFKDAQLVLPEIQHSKIKCDFSHSEINGMSVIYSDLKGTNFSHSKLSQFKAADSNLKSTNFDYASGINISFNETELNNSSMTHINFKTLSAKDSDLSEVDLGDSILNEINLKKCEAKDLDAENLVTLKANFDETDMLNVKNKSDSLKRCLGEFDINEPHSPELAARQLAYLKEKLKPNKPEFNEPMI